MLLVAHSWRLRQEARALLRSGDSAGALASAAEAERLLATPEGGLLAWVAAAASSGPADAERGEACAADSAAESVSGTAAGTMEGAGGESFPELDLDGSSLEGLAAGGDLPGWHSGGQDAQDGQDVNDGQEASDGQAPQEAGRLLLLPASTSTGPTALILS